MSATKHNFSDDAGNSGSLVLSGAGGSFYAGFTVDVGVFAAQGIAAAAGSSGGVTVSGFTDDTALNNAVSSDGLDLVGFNAAGAYGGYIPSGSGTEVGFIYSGGGLTTVTDPNASGAIETGIVGLSDNGQYAVGYWVDTNYNTHYFIDHNGAFEELASPNLNGSDFSFSGINSSGEAVGTYYLANGDSDSFLYEGGTYSDIADPTSGTMYTEATGIADNGDVFGYYDSPDESQAAGFIDSNGSFTDVSDPDAFGGTYVFGIAPDGDIFGLYFDSNYIAHGFIEDNGVFTTVDDPSGVNGTEILGMNGAGEVFGVYYDGNYDPVYFTANETLCYLRGTCILTPAGEVPVESLRIGDLVVTRNGGFRAVKWIGRQNYDARFVARDPAKLPVRIRAGALGEGLPARDLTVSPGHSMLVDGTLLLASTLVNGVTITHEFREGQTHIDYFQPELDGHDCILAEGAWSETFADGPGLRDAYHNAGEFWALYPEYRTPDEIVLCAPRPERGAALDAALRPLVARASAGLVPGHLHGSIDRVSGREIDGWAFDAAHPFMPVLVEVMLAGEVIHTALACDFRQDLRDAGFGLGRCAFFVVLPHALPSELLHTLQVRRACDGAALPMSEACREACGLAPALLLAA